MSGKRGVTKASKRKAKQNKGAGPQRVPQKAPAPASDNHDTCDHGKAHSHDPKSLWHTVKEKMLPRQNRTWITHHYDALPAWFRDNKFIRSGYRVDLGWRLSAQSVCKLHNETMNIWTHMLGFIFVAILMIITASTLSPHGIDYLQLNMRLLSSPPMCNIPPAMSPFHPMCFESSTSPMTIMQSLSENSAKMGANVKQAMDSLRTHLPNLATVTRSLKQQAEVMMAAGETRLEETKRDWLQYLNTLDQDLKSFAKALSESEQKAMHMLQNARDGVVARWAALFPPEPQKFDTVQAAGQLIHEFRVTSANNSTSAVPDGTGAVDFNLLPVWNDPNIKRVHTVLPIWPVLIYMLTAMCCMLFSTFFHTFQAVSGRVADNFQSLDYAGIFLLIAGSTVPLIHYGFFCQPTWQTIYLIVDIFTGVAGCCVSLMPTFRQIQFRQLRVYLFFLVACAGAIPLTHMLFLNNHARWVVSYILGMGAMYIIGAIIYSLQIPERWQPGKYDIFFHSHQLWHVFIFVAVCIHFAGVKKFYEWRMGTMCVA